jgi:hypothetical protein
MPPQCDQCQFHSFLEIEIKTIRESIGNIHEKITTREDRLVEKIDSNSKEISSIKALLFYIILPSIIGFFTIIAVEYFSRISPALAQKIITR